MMESKNAFSCIVLSIPRCGTHLTWQILKFFGMQQLKHRKSGKLFWEWPIKDVLKQLMPQKGHFLSGNHPFRKDTESLFKEYGFYGIFISRDPRDWVVSFSLWEQFHTKGFQFRGMELDQILIEMIKLIPYHYRRLNWREVEKVYSTTYEKVFQQSKVELTNICNFLGIEASDNDIDCCIRQLKKPIPYHKYFFRKGIIGDWKNHFKDYHKDLFKEIAGDLLIKEGYEKDLNW